MAAGIGEEVVFRGYLQRQFWSLSRSLPSAIALQAGVFGSAHVYQGWKLAIGITAYGFAFGLLAAWRKSLLPGILAHAVTDIIGGIVSAR